MTITQAQYVKETLTNTNTTITATIDGITMSVPITTDNRHYQAILDWVSDGNTITPAA